MKLAPLYEILSGHVVSEVIDGEAVIIHMDTGSYYHLNRSGSLVWEALLDRPHHGDQLLRLVSQAYDIDPADSTLGAQVDELLQGLVKEGLLTAAATNNAHLGTSISFSPGSPRTDVVGLFEPPRLDIYTDMQDFLTVDPVHEVDEQGIPRPHHS